MDKKLPEVQGWFREAYPEHEQRILRISSKTWEETENTKKLSTLVVHIIDGFSVQVVHKVKDNP